MNIDRLNLPILFTDKDGRANFREDYINLHEGSPLTRLSSLQASSAMQWRISPVGFSADFHCTSICQWLIVLQGQMDIGLQNGKWRSFHQGECFYSADVLPKEAIFNANIHGHRSKQVGNLPLVTLFVQSNHPH